MYEAAIWIVLTAEVCGDVRPTRRRSRRRIRRLTAAPSQLGSFRQWPPDRVVVSGARPRKPGPNGTALFSCRALQVFLAWPPIQLIV